MLRKRGCFYFEDRPTYKTKNHSNKLKKFKEEKIIQGNILT